VRAAVSQKLAVATLVLGLSALYGAQFVDRGWVPHDEGLLAQGAERILHGEMPHRDFDESYTGGLSYVHALAFRLVGVRLISLRLFFYGFFLLFIVAFYGLASRWLAPTPAGIVTLLAVAWSVPNYFASMPSWYVLFFGTFATFAFVKYMSTGRRWWIFFAGLCAGFSLLFIIVGLYIVAGGLLFLAFREQMEAERRAINRQTRVSPFFLVQIVFCLAFLGLLLTLLSGRLAPMEVFQFLMPGLAVTGVLLWRGWTARSGGTRERFDGLLRLVIPFAVGVLLPVAVFLACYLSSSSLADLARGVFVLPRRQIQVARVPLPPLSNLSDALPYAFLLFAPPARVAGRWALRLIAPVLFTLLLCSGSAPVYRIIWNSARYLLGLVVVGGCGLLLRSMRSGSPLEHRSEEVFLLLAMTALLGLIQFPFSAPIYFCFVAPFMILSLAAIVGSLPQAHRALHGVFLVFYLFFAVIRLNPGYIWNLGIEYEPYRPLALLGLERGGLRVPEIDRMQYETLVSSIRQHCPGRFLYATPDCPEVYFLSGKLNPTRISFDFLRDYGGAETLGRLLDEVHVEAVVLNLQPGFSRQVSPEIRVLLASRFPNREVIGKFLLQWRD
jgi:hypothetical protein